MKKGFFKKLWKALKDTWDEFNADNGIKLSAALAYYTIFSIPPLLIIIITVCGFVFGKEAIQGHVYSQIAGLVGSDAALQIQDAIKNTAISKDSKVASIIGVIVLIIGATGVFSEIQDSINIIWGIKPKPKRGLIKMLINRLLSFSMVIGIGFILLVSLLVNALVELLNTRLQHFFPQMTVYLFYIINIIIIFAVISLLFATIFKILPDGKIKWRDVMTGSFFTAFLFMIGKLAIGYYLGKSNIAGVYGAAGSVIIILVWVYYSSIILYFGAEFTQVYANLYGHSILLNDYAVFVEKVEVEKEVYLKRRNNPVPSAKSK
jgi:membrane protein